ncbi:MAG: beta-ketoacyl-[acyl-carrier-protein] synthase family protein [Chitinophagaceae bacterium]
MYTKNAAVYVAGVGVVSAIGNNTKNCLQALAASRAGIGPITSLDSIYKSTIPVAEVKLTNKALAAATGISPSVSRTALLAAMAAQEAWDDAGISAQHKWRTGFVSANSVGGMDKTEAFFSAFIKDKNRGKLRDVVNHECGAVTELVADRLGIKNFITTVSTACSSSANSIFFGARLIKHNKLDVVVAGGADALTKFTLNGFNTLQILDRAFCQPFDENRRGLNLGEGAGYVVLVSERVAARIKNKMYCRLSGYANANDAHHQTASSPDGAGSYAAMKGALELSGLQTTDISYINLHGTGTFNNDISEGTAIQRLFEPHYPKMSSTKAFTGHTLGASGGIEAVFSSLAIKHGIIYPNLRLQTPIQALPFVPEKTFQENASVNHVLSNSFGFGGNCSSLIFSKL